MLRRGHLLKVLRGSRVIVVSLGSGNTTELAGICCSGQTQVEALGSTRAASAAASVSCVVSC